jgi:hypothetical protein
LNLIRILSATEFENGHAIYFFCCFFPDFIYSLGVIPCFCR